MGEIWMGKTKSLDVVFDTGSDWLVIESINCNTCEGDKYNIKQSLDAGVAKKIGLKDSERVYGSARIAGREYTDTVCITLDKCI